MNGITWPAAFAIVGIAWAVATVICAFFRMIRDG